MLSRYPRRALVARVGPLVLSLEQIIRMEGSVLIMVGQKISSRSRYFIVYLKQKWCKYYLNLQSAVVHFKAYFLPAVRKDIKRRTKVQN